MILSNAELHLDWSNVFRVSSDVTFSLFAGTSAGYGDVINHEATKATSVSVPCSRELQEVFVTIQAADRNGASEVYMARLQA